MAGRDPFADRTDLQELRDRVDLIGLVSGHVALKRTGRRWIGLCPFHSERTPSFSVHPEFNTWHCFGACASGGDCFDFVMKTDGISFGESIQKLADTVGMTIRGPARRDRPDGDGAVSRPETDRDRLLQANMAAWRYFRMEAKRSHRWRDYVDARGLTGAIKSWGLGYAPDDRDGLVADLIRQNVPSVMGEAVGLIAPSRHADDPHAHSHYDRMRSRLVFPIHDLQGRVIAFGGRRMDDPDDAGPRRGDQKTSFHRKIEPKYWNSPESPIFSKSRTLYGLDKAHESIRDTGMAVVVEGYTDVISAHSAGFDNVVATLGTAMTDEHIRIIARMCHEVVLAFDADAAGLKAAVRTQDMFQKHNLSVRVMTLPDGQDPDSIIRAGHADVFEDAIGSSQSLTDFLVETAKRRT